MDNSLQQIKQNAETLLNTEKVEADKATTKKLWLEGEYTDFNRENN